MPDASAETSSTDAHASPRPFVHLHCHTHYSLLDGANRIPDLVAKTARTGMNAIAVTDHGNLSGAMEFYHTCRAARIKPIIGYEAYVAPRSRTDRSATKIREAQSHLTLLAMNRTGFNNLIRMASIAYLEGFHYKPRIDRELLEQYNEGLICLSGCASSELSKLLLADRHDQARALVEWYARVFGDRFYMEIQNAGIDIQIQCLERTVDLAEVMGLPLVATNDAHYLTREDADVQDILLCVNTRTTKNDPHRMKMNCDQLYVRSPQEMYAAFPGQEAAVARSQEIADRVSIQIEPRKLYPVFRPPAGCTDIHYLRELCEQRLHKRYGETVTDEHWKRLEYELSVIEQKGYASYFLIVWDLVEFAKRNAIPCGARGSACGAIVAYLLGLDDVCPIRYDLLFERFLDPSRSEPPDIDIDFCRDRRQMVIDYTRRRYGEKNVAQIGTYGTLKAKAAIRDVGRALSVPLQRVDELAKMVPDTLNIKLEDALKQSPELREQYETDRQTGELLDMAMGLEGLARSAGTHAAGVVVADVPLDTVVPLQTITGKDDVVTQWDGPTIESVGLLKMDFLGLRNLTILDKAVQNVKKMHPDFELDHVRNNLADEATFALLQRGETRGIFQLESGGMRDLLAKMKPDCFADIIATSALYRPGPLEGGMVMEYVDVKHKRKQPRKVHPLVDEVLAETYGVMVYQEQVMRILNRVGNIELSSAYRCIKAISKKKLKDIAAFREEYISGAKANGIDEKAAINLFELIEKFAGYGFNKSHSTAYGLIAYETAYLKAHFPVEFMAALLSCGMESSERINEHVDDARRMKIDVLPPDVNRCEVEFSMVDGTITFGLGAIKGVGKSSLQTLVDERDRNGRFRDIFDLTERVDPRVLGKSTLETLIKAGALDSFGPNRARHLAVVERAVQAAQTRHRDRARGQKSLFETDAHHSSDESASQLGVAEMPDWTHSQKLAAEKEVLGFYLTSHPLTSFSAQLECHATHRNRDLNDLDEGTDVLIGGMISSIRKAATKKPSRNGHTRYANFDFEDPTGIVRCIIWPEDYARYEDVVQTETICLLQGRIDRRGHQQNVIVNRLITLDQADREFTSQVAVKFQRGMHTERDMQRVRDILSRNPGRTEVVLVVDSFAGDEQSAETCSEAPTPPNESGTGSPGTSSNALQNPAGKDVSVSVSSGRVRTARGGSAPVVTTSERATRIRYFLKPGSTCRVSCGPEFRREMIDVIGAENLQLMSDRMLRKTGSAKGS